MKKTNPNLVKCPVCQNEMEIKLLPAHKDIHPTPINEWLYIGSYFNATNKKELNNLNIKFILNCALECKNLYEGYYTYLKLPIKDELNFPIENYFESGINFLRDSRNKTKNERGNVLVHCQLGKSRSATLVMAYLIKELKMNTNDAYNLLKKKRKKIMPNMGFMMKLRDLEKENIVNAEK